MGKLQRKAIQDIRRGTPERLRIFELAKLQKTMNLTIRMKMKIWSTTMTGSNLIKILRLNISRAFQKNGTRRSRSRIRIRNVLSFSLSASTRVALRHSRRVATCVTISVSILVSGRLAAQSATKPLHKVATWADTSKTCMEFHANSKGLSVENQLV